MLGIFLCRAGNSVLPFLLVARPEHADRYEPRKNGGEAGSNNE
jgi:hypothetical protein